MLQEKELSLNGNQISYLINAGSEDRYTVIFIHGFPFRKEMWSGQLLALTGGVTGIAYDIRGFGTSTTDHHFFSIDLFAADLLKFIEQLNLKNIILCGLSMGGYVALRAVERSPQVFMGLLLCDTNASADANENKLGRFESIDKILGEGKEAFANDFIKKVLAETTFESNTGVLTFAKNMILSISEQTLCATQLALASRTDTKALLNNITVPTLIIRGENDKLMTPEHAQGLRTGLSDFKYVEIPNSAHLPNLENPALFNDEVNAFLNHRFPF